MEKYGILTLAAGKKFVIQAKYLSRSCMLHAPHVLRAVITDCPEELKDYYDFVIPYNSSYGNPFSSKTRLHLYTPFENTLFLDADSLLIKPIDFCWEALLSSSFIYTGTLRTKGIWYYNTEEIIAKAGVEWIPEFNSGMMLFRNDALSKNIFESAFTLMQSPENFEVPFFREKMLPDEPFFALAFAKHGIKPFNDYGRFSRTLIGASHIRINVIKGIADFRKYDEQVYPMAVHFCGRFGNRVYFKERRRLFFYFFSLYDFIFINILLLIRRIIKD
jgi:hypothetical protein